MADLNFITSNPALDEFSKEQKEAAAQRLSDAHTNLYGAQTEDLNASRPTRLRTLEAGARAAETGADVGEQTALPLAQAGVRSANAGARTAEVGADYAEPRAKAGLRQMEAGTAQTEQSTKIAGQQKVFDLAIAGNVKEAQSMADSLGIQVDPQILANRSYLIAIKNLHEYVKVAYPDEPANGQRFAEKTYFPYLKGVMEQGGDITDPSLPYKAGRPAPVDENGRPVVAPPPASPEHKNPGTKPAEISEAEWLVAKKIARTDQEAWNMVRQRRDNPEAAYTQVYNSALRANGGDGVAAKQTADEFMKGRATRGAAAPAAAVPTPAPAAPVPVPTAPVAPPAPAQQRPDMMTPGDGGKPVNVDLPPLPPNVPPGSQYSPSRRMWRSNDGQIYDESGNPVGG